jgi:hypothetical protein
MLFDFLGLGVANAGAATNAKKITRVMMIVFILPIVPTACHGKMPQIDAI